MASDSFLETKGNFTTEITEITEKKRRGID
jgi:hypothetical protein